MHRDTRPKRLLVVDDEAQLRAVLTGLLTLEGYVVDEADNGLVALTRMRQVLPDGMVLDLMMPIMGGRRLVELMRAEPSLAGIPFILVSAALGLKDACLALSPHACVAKPYDMDVLLDSVRRLVY